MPYCPLWAPDEVDIETPAPARMYDCCLGGSHNFAADRDLAQKAIAVWPELPRIARANRAFMRRAVSFPAVSGYAAVGRRR